MMLFSNTNYSVLAVVVLLVAGFPAISRAQELSRAVEALDREVLSIDLSDPNAPWSLQLSCHAFAAMNETEKIERILEGVPKEHRLNVLMHCVSGAIGSGNSSEWVFHSCRSIHEEDSVRAEATRLLCAAGENEKAARMAFQINDIEIGRDAKRRVILHLTDESILSSETGLLIKAFIAEIGDESDLLSQRHEWQRDREMAASYLNGIVSRWVSIIAVKLAFDRIPIPQSSDEIGVRIRVHALDPSDQLTLYLFAALRAIGQMNEREIESAAIGLTNAIRKNHKSVPRRYLPALVLIYSKSGNEDRMRELQELDDRSSGFQRAVIAAYLENQDVDSALELLNSIERAKSICAITFGEFAVHGITDERFVRICKRISTTEHRIAALASGISEIACGRKNEKGSGVHLTK